MLAHATGGRRYCFVIMSYHEGYAFFERIKRIVGEETGFECLRADEIPGAGEDLRAKIHTAIEGAVFVMTDISHMRPNIYYELGYAIGRSKPVMILAREGVEVPIDLSGVELIRYIDNRDGWPRFEQSLRQQLSIHKDSSISLVRAMIVPHDPRPSYIILNPKKPQADSRFLHHPRERRTYGDYLGLMGVLSVFASVYGEHCAPELVSASHAADEILDWDANLFLIGSPKVNKFTAEFLKSIQKGRGPNWRFERCAGDEAVSDYEMQLVGELVSGRFETPCAWNSAATEREDHGVIVRGPHPRHPQRTVTIIAGPHSLGSGAAGLAATKSQLVCEISKRLAGSIDLTTCDRAIWILVKGVAGADDHIDISNVTIVDAGVYS